MIPELALAPVGYGASAKEEGGDEELAVDKTTVGETMVSVELAYV